MCVSVVLALSAPIPEVIVAGRQSSRGYGNSLPPAVFEKTGTQTVAAIGGRHYNHTNANQRIRLVHASVVTAPTGAALTVDCKINGTSVFAAAGDRASIAASGFASTGGEPTKTDVDTAVVKPGQYVTVDVAQIGSSVAGADLRVQVVFGAA